jgi:hypothetical protein
MIDNTDEKDIELMFAEARRYDLLTAEQEQSIDSTKWSAVREIYALIAENDELSQLRVSGESTTDSTLSKSRPAFCLAPRAGGSIQ